MQLTDIIKRVQRIFGDEDEVQITVQDIIAWVSDGQMEVARQTECLTKDTVLDFDPTTFTGFAIPSNFILEKRVTWKLQDGGIRPLARTTLESLDNLGARSAEAKGDPTYYYLWAGNVQIYPIGDVARTGAFRLWYVCAPDALSQVNDQLQIPAHMHEDLVRYALMRARELNEDVEQADRMGAELTNRLVQSRAESFNPYKDQYPVVRDYAGDWW